jgi:hypothetical protein
MSARAEYFRQLARKCAAAADAAADPVTKAKFEQEQHQWLLRDEQAVKTERNLMTRPSREGRAVRTLRSLSFAAMALWLAAPARMISSIIGRTLADWRAR